MTKAEAKREVLSAAAALVDPRSGGLNEYLLQDKDGNELPARDLQRMRAAAIELADELRRRAGAMRVTSSGG